MSLLLALSKSLRAELWVNYYNVACNVNYYSVVYTDRKSVV